MKNSFMGKVNGPFDNDFSRVMGRVVQEKKVRLAQVRVVGFLKTF